MDTIGWMLSVNGQRNLRGSEDGLAITFIRPFATKVKLHKKISPDELEYIFQAEEVEVSTSEVLEHYPFLVNPWLHLKHGETKWRFFYSDGGGFNNHPDELLSRSGVEEERVHPAQHKLILNRISEELKELTTGMTQALSSHPDKLEEDKKGFVHSMAPLSQLPPVISNEVLRFGHIIDFPVNFHTGDSPANGSYVDKEVVFIAVPVIEVNGTEHEPDGIEPLAFTGDGLPQMAVVKYGTLKVKTGDIEREFAVIVECARIEDKPVAKMDGVAAPDNRKRDVLSVLGGPLSPLRVATEIIQSGEDHDAHFKKSWVPFLLSSLGNGWLVDDSDTPFDDHVFTVVATEHDCKRLFGLAEGETIDKMLPKQGWDYNKIVYLFKEDFQNPGLTQLRDTAEFWLGIAYLMNQSDSSSETQLVVDTWGEIADLLRDTTKVVNILKDWLSYLLMKFTNEDLQSEARAILPKIAMVINEPTAAECRLRALELVHGLDYDNRVAIIEEIANEKAQDFPQTVSYINSRLSIFHFNNEPPPPSKDNPSPVGLVDRMVKNVVTEAHSIVQKNHSQKPMARDDGLEIQIDSETPEIGDQLIRGYAIALRCEIPNVEQDEMKVKQEWITNTQITCHHDQGSFVISDKNGAASIGMCAIGSAEINGMRVTRAVYDGAPLCSVPGSSKRQDSTNPPIRHISWLTNDKEFDADGTTSLDFGWYSGLENSINHVPLGYGLSYSSVRTAILNNGIVEHPNFRLVDFEATLISATQIQDWGERKTYLSYEAVGEPQLVSIRVESKNNYNLSWADGQSLSNETKASELLGNQTPVTLLVPKGENIYEKGITEINFAFETPLPSPAFIERWLTTDEQLKDDEFSEMIADENLRTSGIDIAAFKRNLLQRIEDVAKEEQKTSNDIDHRYHPAIDYVAFTAKWYRFDLVEPIHKETVFVHIPRSQRDETGRLGPTTREKLRKLLHISIRSVDESVSNETKTQSLMNVQNRAVLIGPGEIVKVFSSSCIDTSLFENENGKLPRYAEIVSKGKPRVEETIKSNDKEIEIKHFLFDGKSHWFECAPRWNEIVQLEDSWLNIEVPTINRPGLARLLLDASGKFPAEHVVGGRVDRHEWHWTGTPVDFSIANGKLTGDWLAVMAGVGSFRNNKTISLAEKIDSSITAIEWRIRDGQALDSIARSSSSSSNILAYTFSPEPRFSSWINTRDPRVRNLRKQVIATGALLRGSAPTERLESPTAKWIIPMTEGYERQSLNEATLPERGRNGALMVFDHALMRTDERSQFAGIGEVIDVEVVETRVLPNFDWANKEMGPNPIFHANPESFPASPEGKKPFRDTSITSSRPFGLTFDKGSNPKVVQTAICVFPCGVGGTWTLAKLRTRRMLEPETLLTFDQSKPLQGGVEKWNVELRKEGEDYIPKDIYIEMNAENWPILSDPKQQLPFKINDTPIPLPDRPNIASSKQRVRLRITWHKDRWGTPKPPEWRPRIDVQIRELNRLEWKATSVASAYAEQVSKLAWNPRMREDARYELQLPASLNNAHWNYLNISDYSDGRWVSFVGMFGQEILGRADEYVLEARKIDDYTEIRLKGDKLPDLQSVHQSLNDAGSSVFNLLNIYRPGTQVMQGKASGTSGEFVGSLPYNDKKQLFTGELNISDIDDCIAYIMSYQHITSLANFNSPIISEKDELLQHGFSLATVEQLVFPKFDVSRGLNQKESIVRPVPQYLGPIRIVVVNES